MHLKCKSFGISKFEFCYFIFCIFSYHRAQDPYTPPENVHQTIEKLKSNAKLNSGTNGKPFTMADKFNFLTICSQEFNHTVPNSALHEMNTIGMDPVLYILYLLAEIEETIGV